MSEAAKKLAEVILNERAPLVDQIDAAVAPLFKAADAGHSCFYRKGYPNAQPCDTCKALETWRK